LLSGFDFTGFGEACFKASGSISPFREAAARASDHGGNQGKLWKKNEAFIKAITGRVFKSFRVIPGARKGSVDDRMK
jgi:hypothetical protein